MSSRRAFLATAATVSITTSGCLGRLSPTRSTTSLTLREPIFEQDSERWQESPFKTAVFSTPEEAKTALNTDMEGIEPAIEQAVNFDPDTEFLGVCASTREFVPQGTRKGWCPEIEIDGDRLVFRFPFEEWPNELEEPYVNRVILRVQQPGLLTSQPTRAAIEIETIERHADIRSCSD